MIAKNSRVLVTGANGYIGRHVVQALLDKGFKVLAADINLDGIDERVEKITGNIMQPDKDIFEKSGKPDVCIHLAWKDGFAHNSDAHITELPNHYLFIKNMIEGGLKHIVVMGSMHEIGYFEGAIDENSPANPSSLYGISKNALRKITEGMVKEHNICWQWLRGYYILGDDLKNHSVFTKITQMEMEGKEKFPFTTGKNLYDFIYIDELAEQIALAATQEEVQGVVNCCTGNPVSLADQVSAYIKKHNYKIVPDYGVYPDRPYDSPGVWGDASKINKIIENSKK